MLLSFISFSCLEIDFNEQDASVGVFLISLSSLEIASSLPSEGGNPTPTPTCIVCVCVWCGTDYQLYPCTPSPPSTLYVWGKNCLTFELFLSQGLWLNHPSALCKIQFATAINLALRLTKLCTTVCLVLTDKYGVPTSMFPFWPCTR